MQKHSFFGSNNIFSTFFLLFISELDFLIKSFLAFLIKFLKFLQLVVIIHHLIDHGSLSDHHSILSILAFIILIIAILYDFHLFSL